MVHKLREAVKQEETLSPEAASFCALMASIVLCRLLSSTRTAIAGRSGRDARRPAFKWLLEDVAMGQRRVMFVRTLDRCEEKADEAA